MEVRYSLCPNCDACPEVVIGDQSVVIGEEGNQVRLSGSEWNELVAAVKEGRLLPVGPTGGPSAAAGPEREHECCG